MGTVTERVAGPPKAAPRPPGRRLPARASGLAGWLAVLFVVLLASVAIGTKDIPLPTVLDALVDHDGGSPDQALVRELRLPRTGLGLVTGAALGLAGALMQALTRNPLADPGILGVNSGASAGAVLAIGFAGFQHFSGYVWFALAGAGLVSVMVHLIGSAGPGGATPIRLVLAGAALSAALTALVTAVLLMRPEVFDAFRFWTVGSLAGRQADTLWQVLPLLLAGMLLALALARPLDALTLGDDVATSLGGRPARTRVAGVLAVTLLCGGATAAVGPIAFVGLAVPHLARRQSGQDHRWILAYSAVLGAVLLLAADVLGRVLTRPGELEVAVVTAFLGAPALIMLSRRNRRSGR
ncbi:iron chelate uptake ABC transporter family permease subunit [Streptomyces uncialis]|uniref:iron chelate uptake ABC transporter family permease subunit n=1 Tax=Streptomyces uncialis TaxID=1048205 RepID=UPI00379C12BF